MVQTSMVQTLQWHTIPRLKFCAMRQEIYISYTFLKASRFTFCFLYFILP